MEEFSRLVFHTLDYMGYNRDVIQLRRMFWHHIANKLNTSHYAVHLTMAGSKIEGLTSMHESDVDFMALFNDAICTDNVSQAARLQDKAVIYADTSETPPGYTRLKLVSRNGILSRYYWQESTFEAETQSVYLSSSLFATNLKMKLRQQDGGKIFGKISGPAIEAHNGHASADCVVAFNCYYPELLQTWISRPRHHEWPPLDVREEAASMLAQVVPVGSKGSCDQWREWRFCFIESELKLTHSLNETQKKLYILLKMVAKEILCHVCKEISSYIMKNITYWLSELLPETVFKSENLLKLLILSLRFLKLAIRKWNRLPYYMIPGRNLLAERLTPVSRRQLSGLLDTLIQEGPRFILRCTKLQTAMTVRLAAPALLIRHGLTRDRVEMLEYCKVHLNFQDDLSYKEACDNAICDILLPEWRRLIFLGILGKDVENMVIAKTKEILS